MKENAHKAEEEVAVDPIPQTEEQQLQQGIEDGTHEVRIAFSQTHCNTLNHYC